VKLRVLEQADAEAAEAAEWYEKRAPGLGSVFLADLQDAFQLVQDDPRRHGMIETTTVQGEVRRAQLNRFPYIVVFEILEEEEAIVLAVAHAAREPGYWRSRGSGG